MSERLNLACLAVLTAALALAGFMLARGDTADAKDITLAIVSGVLGLLGGHALGKATTTTGDVNVIDKP